MRIYMNRKFSEIEIKAFKDEAHAMKGPGLTFMQARNVIARREGYKNWDHLEKAIKPPNANSEHQASSVEIVKWLITRLEASTSQEVTSLLRNGSIWIYPSHIKKNCVSHDSFVFLGQARDGITREYSTGLKLLVDFDGMAESGVLETEISEDEYLDQEELAERLGGYPILTIEVARDDLIKVARDDASVRLDSDF
jgi:hypothetical protein